MKALRSFRLHIDESGNHQMGGKCERYLGLLGVVVPLDTYQSTLKPAMLEIKRTFFSSDPDSPVVMHRDEIAQRRGVFAVLENPAHRQRFNEAMLNFYRQQEYALLAVVIDKESHREMYGTAAKHPYHYCAEAMLERFYFFLRENNGIGDVFAESRGQSQDGLLLREWERLCRVGTYYVRRDQIARRFLNNQIQFRTKEQNVYGLQLADMLAKVCTRDVLVAYGHCDKFRSGFEHRVALAIASKYRSKNGRADGYGKKLLCAQKRTGPDKETPASGKAPVSEGPGDHG